MVRGEAQDNHHVFLRLIELDREEQIINPADANLRIEEMKGLVAAVQTSWTAALFGDIPYAALERYYTYQFDQVSRLFQEFQNANRNLLMPLLDKLYHDLGKYIDPDASIYPSVKTYLLSGILAQVPSVQAVLLDAPLDDRLNTFLARYLDEMSGLSSGVCSFAQMRFFKSFIEELSSLIEPDGKLPAPVIYERLLALEFNQFEVYVYHQERLRNSFKGKTRSGQLKLIDDAIRYVNFNSRGTVERYDRRWPALSVMLLDWLKGERLRCLAKERTPENPSQSAVLKLALRLPVSHLAFLIRLLYKEEVFGLVSLQDIFNFFAAHTSTKRQENLSAGGLSKEYYTKNMVTAAEVRALLSKMLTRINRDYFPVWVVIYAIFFCR